MNTLMPGLINGYQGISGLSPPPHLSLPSSNLRLSLAVRQFEPTCTNLSFCSRDSSFGLPRSSAHRLDCTARPYVSSFQPLIATQARRLRAFFISENAALDPLPTFHPLRTHAWTLSLRLLRYTQVDPISVHVNLSMVKANTVNERRGICFSLAETDDIQLECPQASRSRKITCSATCHECYR